MPFNLFGCFTLSGLHLTLIGEGFDFYAEADIL